MNAGEFSVRNQRVVFVSIAFVLLGGIVAYQRLGRLEDPEFTIKEASEFLVGTSQIEFSAQQKRYDISTRNKKKRTMPAKCKVNEGLAQFVMEQLAMDDAIVTRPYSEHRPL
jgi:hypothetical protein